MKFTFPVTQISIYILFYDLLLFFFDIVLLIFFMASSSLVSWRRRLLVPYLIGVVVSGFVVPSGVVVRW